MFFCRCFLKGIAHSKVMFLETILWKQLFGNLQGCVRWQLFKQLKHRFFFFAKSNQSAGAKDLYLLHLKNLCWFSHRMHSLLINVSTAYFSSVYQFFFNSCFAGRYASLNSNVLFCFANIKCWFLCSSQSKAKFCPFAMKLWR